MNQYYKKVVFESEDINDLIKRVNQYLKGAITGSVMDVAFGERLLKTDIRKETPELGIENTQETYHYIHTVIITNLVEERSQL